ncbi:protein ALP1-like [Aphis craccivora]|uniref:Protein ALP1-like n=1 Tax=Aphis craccivora TaxID=307492 RepID=A0A6G0VUN6_APHCR|nr:protein ALP1-like [Aphis craccivora]
MEYQKKKKQRSVWERKWIQRRKLHGAYNALSRELRMEDPSQLRNFIRMSAEDFEELSSWIAPMFQKMDTNMRQAISVGERLMLTLRFLATGDSYASLSYLFRIPANTICGIVPEVCQALSDVLQEKGFLKVLKILLQFTTYYDLLFKYFLN